MHIERNEKFAWHIGEKLKHHCAMCISLDGQKMCVIDWENWKEIYMQIIGAGYVTGVYNVQMSVSEMRRHNVDKKRNEMFYSAAECNRYRKCGKRGFNMQFDQCRAEERMNEMDKYLREVRNGVREIAEVL